MPFVAKKDQAQSSYTAALEYFTRRKRLVVLAFAALVVSSCGVLSSERQLVPVEQSGWLLKQGPRSDYERVVYESDKIRIVAFPSTLKSSGAFIAGAVPVVPFEYAARSPALLIMFTSKTDDLTLDLRRAQVRCSTQQASGTADRSHTAFIVSEWRLAPGAPGGQLDLPYVPGPLTREKDITVSLHLDLSPERVEDCIVHLASVITSSQEPVPELRFHIREGTALRGMA
jgi:hypothetical protein